MTRRFNFALSAFVAFGLLSPPSNWLTAQERTLPDGPAAGASVDRFI